MKARQVLVVANRTLLSERLLAEVCIRAAAGPCRFHLLVPATPPGSPLVWTEGGARAAAASRLAAALGRFEELGAEVSGRIADPSPMTAVADALAESPFDEIVVSTLPPGQSRWLRQDLPTRLANRFGVPVRVVVARRAPTPPRHRARRRPVSAA